MDTVEKGFQLDFWIGVLMTVVVLLSGVVIYLYRDARIREKEYVASEKANIEILSELKGVLTNFRSENHGLHGATLRAVEKSEERITQFIATHQKDRKNATDP